MVRPAGYIYNTCLLAAQVDPLGYRTSYTYGRFNNQLTKQDALGYVWSTLYDNTGYATGSVDPLGCQTSVIYNAAKQKIADIDQLGYATSYFYDTSARPLASQDALGYRTSTVYNARDAVAKQDALGNLWSTTYDVLDRSIASITPLGFVTSTIYDAAGQNIARIDSLGYVTSYSYDASGNRTSVAVPATAFVTGSRSDSPPSSVNLTSEGTLDWAQYGYASGTSFCHKATGGGLIGDPTGFGGAVFHWYGGNYTSFNWTDGNPLTTEAGTQNGIYTEDTPGQGYQILVAADTTPRTLKLYCGGWASLGKLTATLSDGTTATYLDIAGNEGTNYYCVYTIEFQASQPGVQLIIQWELNTVPGDGNTNLIAASLVSSPTLTGQNVSEFVYSTTSNRLAAEIDPLGFTTSYIYDLAGEKLQRINPQGYAISWTYDLVGRQLAVTNEVGLSTSYVYDSRGLATTREFGNGQVTSYLYDAVGQQLQSSYADGTAVTFRYDPRGFNTTVIDWAGYTTSSFDARGLLSGKTDPGAIAQAYAYDGTQNRIGLINPDGGVFTYAYDGLGRSANVINPSNESISFLYDANSRRTTLSFSFGSRIMQYDPAGQLTTIVQYQGATVVQSFGDTYDGSGLKTSHNVNGTVTTYLNDAKGRLLGQSDAGVTATFSYDSVENTLIKWHQGTAPLTMSYDPASRLAQVLNADTVTTYGFDNNGNMTQEYVSNGGLSFMKTVYHYDPENRASNVIAGSAVSTYTYAGNSGLRRTRQEAGQSVHTIVWDGSDYLGEY